MLPFISHVASFILHIDRSLAALHVTYGNWLYAILFLIIFCETGLVIAPFLPGDSLLFAIGALAGLGVLNIWIALVGLVIAAILGDTLNYSLGRRLGTRVMVSKQLFSIPINPTHLIKAEAFFKQHGHRAIFLARFAPIIRTFVPFFAGIAHMPRSTFLHYNIIGAMVWVGVFVGGGYFFGNLPLVKERFGLVIIGIVVVSLIPIMREYWKGRNINSPTC